MVQQIKEKGYKINEIFPENTSGIVTMGDGFIIGNNKNQIIENVNDFLSNNYKENDLKRKLMKLKSTKFR